MSTAQESRVRLQGRKLMADYMKACMKHEANEARRSSRSHEGWLATVVSVVATVAAVATCTHSI